MQGPVKALLAVTNAGAGGGEEQAAGAAVRVLRQAAEVAVASTSSPEDLDAVLAGRDGRPLVVLGGDGSIHAAVAALHRRGELGRAVLGLVPLGTGNDLARTLGLPLQPAEAAAVVAAGRPRRLDLLEDDTGDVAVNAVNAGIGASAAEQAAPFKARLGALGYAVGAVLAGVREPGWRMSVRADRTGVARAGGPRVLHLVIGNGATVGGGSPVAPGADPADGRVDVMVSFAVGRTERLVYALRLRRGEHVARDDVAMTRAEEVAWSATRPVPYNVDGEFRRARARAVWRVRPGVWRLLLP